MYSERSIAILVNPFPESQRISIVAEHIDMLLNGMGVQHKIFDQVWPEHLENFSEAWVVGGDGTLHFFINQYPHIQIPVTIFKGGSGNDFHWMLYGDCKVEQQVEQMLVAKPFPVDAGSCNGRLFLNGIGIGFDGAIVKDLVGKKKISGKSSYLLSIIKHIMLYDEKPCTIRIGKETIMQDCFMISVANGRRYGGGFHVAPKASVNDGQLDINIIGRISPIRRMRYLPVIEKGEHLELPFVIYKQGALIKIQSDHELPA
ncbi:MAG: hypothetical protein H0U44_10460, partial [Flavisolibacter sp.]|nr:hypothetical protein [Flavisolibacter sp.]